MLPDRHGHRIAEGKVAITARLPSRLVARVDLAVAHRHLADDWVTRVAIIEECLERFLTQGGIAGTTTRPRCVAADKKPFRLHLNYESAQAIYGELVVPAVAHERRAPWEILTIAILDHIDAVDCGLPNDLLRDQMTGRQSPSRSNLP